MLKLNGQRILRYLLLALMAIAMLSLLTACASIKGTQKDIVLEKNTRTKESFQNSQNQFDNKMNSPSNQPLDRIVPIRATESLGEKKEKELSDSEQVARDFIEESFSICGSLLKWDSYHSESGHMKLFVELRTDIFKSRRTLSKIADRTYSISLEKNKEYVDGRLMFYHFSAVEQIDSGIAKTQYALLLQEEAGEWKLVSALSDDSGSMQLVGKPFIRQVQAELHAGNIKDVMHLLHEMPVKILDPEEMIRISKLEEATIQEEAKQMNEGSLVPQSTDDLDSLSFSRFAMRNYQNKWALSRNPNWGDFSKLGGDCQNYASQVIFAGGAPMDQVGSYQWYYLGPGNRVPAWTGVRSMQTYILNNSGVGPHGVLHSSANTLLCGDMIHIDWDYDGLYDHAVVIYNAGSNPTLSSHTQDLLNYELSNLGGSKRYIHLSGYDN